METSDETSDDKQCTSETDLPDETVRFTKQFSNIAKNKMIMKIFIKGYQ